MGWSALVPFLPVIGSLMTNIWSSREASKNREFQERMSSTAHQRNIADMRKAGMNPALAQLGSGGASSPSGSSGHIQDMGPSVGSAAIVKAQLRLLDEQANRENASAVLARTQAADIATTAASGRLDQIRSQAELVEAQGEIARMDVEQRRQLLPIALEQAKASLAGTLSSARAAEARAVLDELQQGRLKNIDEFERRLGQTTPAVRFLIELIRNLPGGLIGQPLPRP